MLRLLVALAACHLAKSETSCAPDDSCALDETAFLQMKTMRSLAEVRNGKQIANHDTTKAVVKAAKKHLNKALALIKHGEEAEDARNHLNKALALFEDGEEAGEEEEDEVAMNTTTGERWSVKDDSWGVGSAECWGGGMMCRGSAECWQSGNCGGLCEQCGRGMACCRGDGKWSDPICDGSFGQTRPDQHQCAYVKVKYYHSPHVAKQICS